MGIEKRYELTLVFKDEDQADVVDETLLTTLLTASLEDENIDAKLEIDPVNLSD